METYKIYGITDCPACLRACALLMEKGIEYSFVESDFSPSYRRVLKKQWNWNTFPIIVKLNISESNDISTTLVGGYEELLDILACEDSGID